MSKVKISKPLVWSLSIACIVILTGTFIAVRQLVIPRNIDSFASCKATGVPILETYPEQCVFDSRTFVNNDQTLKTKDDYLGLTEQEASDMAQKSTTTYRIVEREGEPLAVTMDFSPMRFNFYVKDGRVYRVTNG